MIDKITFFEDIIHELNNSKINYWLNFGSVLAAVRNKGKLFDYDHDIDIAFWQNDYELIMKVCQKLEKKNYAINYQKGFHSCEDLIQIYREKKYVKQFHIDFYLLKQKNNIVYSRNIHAPTNKFGKYYFKVMVTINQLIKFNFIKKIPLNILGWFYEQLFSTHWFVFPKKLFDEFEKINFEGHQINIPKKYNDFLEYCYGESWQIPDKNWKLSSSGFIEKRKLNE